MCTSEKGLKTVHILGQLELSHQVSENLAAKMSAIMLWTRCTVSLVMVWPEFVGTKPYVVRARGREV